MTVPAMSAPSPAVGDELPALVIPITRTLIVSAAIASRDFQDVHHDHELAHSHGSPDIFMNILTTNGLVGRFVTDWGGPTTVIDEVSIRLGVPNYPGDTMQLTGKVEEVEPVGVGNGSAVTRVRVVVSVRGSNDRGDHVTGRVTLTLPASPVARDGQVAS